ncbi:T9SS type A sorting domain-containing protein [candidate division KSB1 bacterium]|nr:T9SS type A sorting domain-containing protein [candidate division KSB1 bacterium]
MKKYALKTSRQWIVLLFCLFATTQPLFSAYLALTDDFDDGVIDGSLWKQEAGSGTLVEADGALQLNYNTGSSPHQQIRTSANLMATYIDMTVRIKPIWIAGNKNIGFWLGDTNTGAVTGYTIYFHNTNSHSLQVAKWFEYTGSNHPVQPLDSTPKMWDTEAELLSYHDVRIIKNGHTYTFYVDGEQIAQDSDPTNQPTSLYWSPGRSWMEVRDGEYGEVWVQNMSYCGATAPIENFSDDLKDDSINLALWAQEPGSGTIVEDDGALQLDYTSGSSPHRQIRSTTDLMATRIDMTVRIKPVSIASNKNIGFWLGDINSGAVTGYTIYFHSTNSYSLQVAKWFEYTGSNHPVQSINSTPKTWNSSAELFTYHDVRILKDGHIYTFYVDGEQIAQDTDPTNQPMSLYWSLGRSWMEVRDGEHGEVWVDQIDYAGSSGPINIELLSFEVQPTDSTVELFWKTAPSNDLAGFNIYRQSGTGNPFCQINEKLIIANRDSFEQLYSYSDVWSGDECHYFLEIVYLDGTSSQSQPIYVAGMDGIASRNPAITFTLEQNYPNPFNPTTTICYSLPRTSEFCIEIYDIVGRLIRTLMVGRQSAGQYAISWDATDDGGLTVASGLYYYAIRAGDFYQVRRMQYMK